MSFDCSAFLRPMKASWRAASTILFVPKPARLIAKQIGLDRVVRTDDLDVTKPTRAARAVLADVCEAVIAAFFLDGGMDKAKRLHPDPLAAGDGRGRRSAARP
jgi:hypothetical protein